MGRRRVQRRGRPAAGKRSTATRVRPLPFCAAITCDTDDGKTAAATQTQGLGARARPGVAKSAARPPASSSSAASWTASMVQVPGAQRWQTPSARNAHNASCAAAARHATAAGAPSSSSSSSARRPTFLALKAPSAPTNPRLLRTKPRAGPCAAFAEMCATSSPPRPISANASSSSTKSRPSAAPTTRLRPTAAQHVSAAFADAVRGAATPAAAAS
mmetsp:Transcript_15459/g.47862  ORF Transcript_15459/g.47862 Transcript_15459/m.47862 type:complete len:216 (+) Transcript_15459:316-963(+)